MYAVNYTEEKHKTGRKPRKMCELSELPCCLCCRFHYRHSCYPPTTNLCICACGLRTSDPPTLLALFRTHLGGRETEVCRHRAGALGGVDQSLRFGRSHRCPARQTWPIFTQTTRGLEMCVCERYVWVVQRRSGSVASRVRNHGMPTYCVHRTR